ncbi:MAG: type II toxin-antitoxin system Phd/YefM family antitoxin [Chitinispirillaceae bacterium]
MKLKITEDVKSITDLKRNANGLVKQVHTTHRPVVLTVNGKAEAVLMDAEDYEKMSTSLAMLKLLLPAEEDIQGKKVKPAADFFKEFKCEKGIRS